MPIYFHRLFFFGMVLCWMIQGCQPAHQQEKATQAPTFFDQVTQIPDSILVGDMVIYNLFKYQILAHQNGDFDSTMIVDQVYKRHQKVWDELYGVLFDAKMFSTESGMVDWNRKIFREKEDAITARVQGLMDAKFSQQLEAALAGIKKLTHRAPENVRISIILAPLEGIGFGGMENDAFVLDLLDTSFDVLNMVEEGIPHELNHFIYDPTRKDDPHKDSPLRLTIDEGFACYYTYRYFDGQISKAQAVEQMSEQDWQWYAEHEKEVYEKCAPFFYYEGDEDPLRQLHQDLGAPKTLFYWLGFRIVDFYVQKHGDASWLDLYELPVQEVLEKSGYAEYIKGLP